MCNAHCLRRAVVDSSSRVGQRMDGSVARMHRTAMEAGRKLRFHLTVHKCGTTGFDAGVDDGR